MAKINQKDHCRQRAALCYEIAATMLGDKATSMIRLGDTYAGLAEDFDKPRTDVFVTTEGNDCANVFVTTEGNDCANCVKCGREMRHAYSLPRTDTLRAMQAFRCDRCNETMIWKER